jgi:hypothetical protein
MWIDERISELALYFGISVISSSVISNHFHIVLRTPPPSAGCANWQDHSAGRGSMVAPPPAASILSTRKRENA